MQLSPLARCLRLLSILSRWAGSVFVESLFNVPMGLLLLTHCLWFLPLVCRGSVRGPCFVMQYVLSYSTRVIQ